MPQPLSSLRRHVGYVLNSIGVYPLRERPALALAAMEGIATWATVESWMLDLYLDLAGGNKTLAAELFLTLESNSARSAAIVPLIAPLEKKYRDLYAAIAKLVKTRGRARDRLGHWVWGYSGQLPDALLLANPKAMSTLDWTNPEDRERVNAEILYYTAADFAQIVRDNEELAGFGFKFRWIVTNHPSNREDRLYHELCAAPALAEILHHQAERDRSPQREA
jgi:hypothetical protein